MKITSDEKGLGVVDRCGSHQVGCNSSISDDQGKGNGALDGKMEILLEVCGFDMDRGGDDHDQNAHQCPEI
jgi:hypothetical protein